MAESVFTHLVSRRGLSEHYIVDSAATHTDELGNPPHRGTRNELCRRGIPLVSHRARLMSAADAKRFDYLIGMDEENLRCMRRIAGDEGNGKIYLLLDFTKSPRAIADPWYTGDFASTYEDVAQGCTALLDALERREKTYTYEE